MIKTSEFRTAENGLAITIFVPERGDGTEAHFTMQAGPGELPEDPRSYLHRAIEALQAELADVERCPVHRIAALVRTPDLEASTARLVEALRPFAAWKLSTEPMHKIGGTEVILVGPLGLDADILKARQALSDHLQESASVER